MKNVITREGAEGTRNLKKEREKKRVDNNFNNFRKKRCRKKRIRNKRKGIIKGRQGIRIITIMRGGEGGGRRGDFCQPKGSVN